MRRSSTIIIKHFQTRYETFNHRQIAFWHLTFFCPIDKLHQCYRTYTHPARIQVKPLSDMYWFILNSENTDIGIQHEFQHQNDSLSCIAG
ncbi:putative peptidase [Escherichia coli 2-005-03_S3_C1]|nr:putative peptidase [Escherichia coli 2-005-03_S3_C1]KDW67500.1 putative peptidase [Escherichia coli 2-005-03_S3_C3]